MKDEKDISLKSWVAIVQYELSSLPNFWIAYLRCDHSAVVTVSLAPILCATPARV